MIDNYGNIFFCHDGNKSKCDVSQRAAVGERLQTRFGVSPPSGSLNERPVPLVDGLDTGKKSGTAEICYYNNAVFRLFTNQDREEAFFIINAFRSAHTKIISITM